MNRLTRDQREAVAAQGNGLVVAGAGTGKTSTLVARCLSLIEAGESLEHLLLVTFTEAAAAEMRQRIRQALEVAQTSAMSEAARDHCAHQLALLDSARISTLHAFCLELVRRHFHDLAIDPEVMVLDEAQTQPLARETLDTLFARHCAEGAPDYAAVRSVIRNFGQGSDAGLRPWIVRLHRYAQTLSDPSRWLAEQTQVLEQPNPDTWRGWLLDGVREWREEWLPELRLSPALPNLTECISALESLPAEPTFAQCADAFSRIEAAEQADWDGQKGTAHKPIKAFFEAAQFLASLVEHNGQPLAEDWGLVRGDLLTLLRLTQEFAVEFGRAKRELGGVDFADLEQFALRLLRTPGSDQPSAIASQWREQFHHVFVDEVQDINAAQDAILRALSREGSAGNRFLVGDVKQSIYRFRLADPHIFARYETAWRGAGTGGQRFHLADNFRSREALLDFLNPLFAALLRPTLGGVRYDESARLRFGAPAERAAFRAQPGDEPRVELHVLRKPTTADSAPGDSESADTAEVMDESGVEREAYRVAGRLRALKELEGRPWRDLAVLVRSLAGRVEGFAKAFQRAGVPLAVARDGFFSALEVSDPLNLLKLLDNPLQDLPLLAVLRSPFVGVSVDELALLRAHNAERPLWRALLRFTRDNRAAGLDDTAVIARAKLTGFVERFLRWRERVRHSSLSAGLETALHETHYEALLHAEPRAPERLANLRRLLDLARQFDPYQRQGLHRFLRFVEGQSQEELEPEPGLAPVTDAVRLMTIHQSKGLEFPVVALAGLGTSFNFRDLQGAILLNEQYGLCPKVLAPQSRMRYPSLPHWLGARHERLERLGEELRLLYVATTRARDTLLLFGTAPTAAAGEAWGTEAPRALRDREVRSARCALDWLRLWLPQATPAGGWVSDTAGRSPTLRWWLHDAEAPPPAPPTARIEPPAELRPPALSPAEVQRLQARLTWQYPHLAATRETAKASVSALRRRGFHEPDEEARAFAVGFEVSTFPRAARREPDSRRTLSAAEIGSTTHRFLELVSLHATAGVASLRAEAERFRGTGRLGADEFAALDFAALAAFWDSEVGRRIRVRAADVRRELPFTARFSPVDLTSVGVPVEPGLAADEFIVVQGIADLVVVGAKELWLLDFKTDRLKKTELADKVTTYRPQVGLYALALSRIYGRPVTERWLHFLSLNRTVPL